MTTEVDAVTALVVMLNISLVDPAGTVTVRGTVAPPALLLDRETTAPPEGAGALSVTPPVVELPPVTVAAFRLSDDSPVPMLCVK